MTDPNEALVEELAKAIGEAVLAQDDMAAGVGLNNNLTVDWLDQGETDFGIVARAILPIIARVRDEALKEAAVISDTYYNPSDAIRELKGKP